jgi:hypothetical protein
MSMSLDTEKEVMLYNIDYFEQWDRVYLKFKATEKQVLASMRHHAIKLI